VLGLLIGGFGVAVEGSRRVWGGGDRAGARGRSGGVV
jgi:hypothetical protein